MALEATFRTLSVQIRKLCDILNAVQLTAGDRPLRRGAALADELENTVLDMLGSLEEASAASRTAEKAVAAMDLARARRALAQCQDIFHGIARQFANDLVSYEKLRSLSTLGSERGGEWKAWAGSMQDAIAECREPIEQTTKSLAACWQELAERLGMTNVSVTATNIGQQITTAADVDGKEFEREGVT